MEVFINSLNKHFEFLQQKNQQQATWSNYFIYYWRGIIIIIILPDFKTTYYYLNNGNKKQILCMQYHTCFKLQISITLNGPCLRILSAEDSVDDCFVYPLTSFMELLNEAPTLLIFLNVINIHVDNNLIKESHVKAHPEYYAIPPLVHSNMTAIGSITQTEKTV